MRKCSRAICVLAVVLALATCEKQEGMPARDFGPGADADGHVQATETTAKANAAVSAELPLDDQAAFEGARRGFIATDDPLVTPNAAGDVIWNRPAYDFVKGDAPPSVNPSPCCWRSRRAR